MLSLSQSHLQLQRRSISPRPNSKYMNSREIEEMKKTLKIELNNEEIDKEYHPPPIRRKNCMYFSFVKM